MTPLSGSMPAEAIVYDATTACTYDAMEFPIGVGACLLWAVVDASPDAGSASDVTLAATVEPGQSCVFALASGPVNVLVSNGTLTVGAVTELTLAGNLMAEAGAPSGYLQWSFVGQ